MRRLAGLLFASGVLVAPVAFGVGNVRAVASALPSASVAQARALMTALEPASRVPLLRKLTGRVRLAQSATGTAAAEPSVRTDKFDYAPGDTAIIAGSGFAAGETVFLQVKHTDGTAEGGAGHEPWPVGADGNGDFGHAELSWCSSEWLQVISYHSPPLTTTPLPTILMKSIQAWPRSSRSRTNH